MLTRLRQRLSVLCTAWLRQRPTRCLRAALEMEVLEERMVLSGQSFLDPLTIAPSDNVAAQVATLGGTDYYQLDLSVSGRLTAQLTPDGGSGLDGRLSLYVQNGSGDPTPVIVSDGATPADNSATVDEHLEPGTYFLTASAAGGMTTGAYHLATTFTPAFSPFEPIPLGASPSLVVSHDFDGDNIPDLAVFNVTDSTSSSPSIIVEHGLGDGSFAFESQTAVAYPTTSIPVAFNASAIVTGDFNGDHHTDLALLLETVPPSTPGGSEPVARLLIFLNDGHGGFTAGDTLTVGLGYTVQPLGAGPGGSPAFTPFTVQAGDVDGDGKTDLAVSYTIASNQVPLPGVPSSSTGGVSVFYGMGNGSFEPEVRQDVAGNAGLTQLVTGRFDGDTIDDLAAADTTGGTIRILLGRANRQFQESSYAGSFIASALVSGDFNGDGHPDVLEATSNAGQGGSLVILRGDGMGGFTPQSATITLSFSELVAGDLNGDGKTDLTIFDNERKQVAALLNRGGGVFQGSTPFFANGQSLFGTNEGLASADFNGDGKDDIVILTAGESSTSNDGTAEVFLSTGIGFEENSPNSAGPRPLTTLTADFNNDGRPDLVVANGGGGANQGVTILLGLGDGTFQTISLNLGITAGNSFSQIAVGDFNRDGRPDLAIARQGASGLVVQLLLGLGDGTFRTGGSYQFPPPALTAGASFITIANITAGDFDGDGILDVAATVVSSQFLTATTSNDATVWVIFGKGDGTFRGAEAVAHPGADVPLLLVPTNLDGDNRTDLAYSFNEYMQTTNLFGMPVSQFVRSGVTALLNRGGGAFSSVTTYDTVQLNNVLLAGQFDAGTTTDLVAEAEGSSSDSIELFHGIGNGGFTVSSQDLGVKVAQIDGRTPFTTGDFNGDGMLDLAFEQEDDSSGTPTFRFPVFFNDGTGLFTGVGVGGVSTPGSALALLSADFNGDGPQDLAVIQRPLEGTQLGFSSLGVAFVLLNITGVGIEFVPSIGLPSAQVQSTPRLADIDGDTVNDVVIVDRSGNVLYRKGLTPLGAFDAPVIVNPGMPARDAVVYATAAGNRIAALDARPDPGTGLYKVRLYALQSDGSFSQTGSLAVGVLPSRLAAGRLDKDALDDLIVTNGGEGDVSIFLQTSPDSFTELPRQSVGDGPLDVALANIDGVGGLDAIITNQVSSDISVLLNPGTSDTPELRFRSGAGLHGIIPISGLVTASEQRPASVAVLPSSGGNRADVLVADTGAATIAKLSAAGFDGFADALSAIPGIEADAIVTGFLNNDNLPDAVVLDSSKSTITVYLGTQSGGFTALPSMDVGLLPSGLTLANVDGKGGIDLLVGNQFGDVRLFLGKGDGTFSPFRPPAGAVPLDVTDINGDGVPDVVLADQNANLVSVRTRIKGTDSFTEIFKDNQTNSQLLEPGKVLWRDLNNDGLPDAVVAASGSNSILVYLNSPTGLKTAAVYPTGTNPTGMAFMDFNGDGVPDLAVTNSGSNDVSILFGSIQNGQWVAVPGPRLRAGTDPGNIELRDINIRAATGNPNDPGLDGIPDLVIADNASGTVRVLPGVGNGFFNDTNPVTLNLGGPIVDMSGNFALLSDGRVVGFNLAAQTAATVFTDPRGGTALQAVGVAGLAFPALFTANADGTVSALLTADGTSYFEAAARTSAALEDPGALSVLASSNGGLEVYVTDRNSDGLVVLRFTADELVVGLSAVESGAPLAVVATLSNSLIVENNSPGVDSFADAGNVFSSGESGTTTLVEGEHVVALGQKLLSGINDALAALGQLSPGEEVPVNLQQFIVGVDEALRQLGLKDEVDAMGSLVDPGTDIGDWLRRAKEAIERMLQRYTPPKPDSPKAPPQTPALPEEAQSEANPEPNPLDVFFEEMNGPVSEMVPLRGYSAAGEMEDSVALAGQSPCSPTSDRLTPVLIAAVFAHQGNFPRLGGNDRAASPSRVRLKKRAAISP